MSSEVDGNAFDSAEDGDCDCEGLSIAGNEMNGFTYSKATGGNKGSNSQTITLKNLSLKDILDGRTGCEY